MNQIYWFILLPFLLLGLLGCQGPAPKKEYTLARAAVQAAQDADAARFSPNYWHKAVNTFRRARKLYTEKDHDLAKQYFERARVLAERAENISQLKRAKGEEAF